MSELNIYELMTGGASRSLWMALEGVNDENFGKRPAAGANSINFIYFHILRHWDRDINVFCNRQNQGHDAWHRHGISESIGYEPPGKGLFGIGTGYGYSEAEVDELPVDSSVLNRYHQILEDETERFLVNVDPGTLEIVREIDGSEYTVGRRLRHLIAHTFMHIGDIEFAKGLLGESPADLPTLLLYSTRSNTK